ncbi:nuclear transcription factor Y subunit B-6-like [Gastrolobium bilobum]|nr:nuclear transcription factor Y subunit B-6-like [Gastrolobium bilobum]
MPNVLRIVRQALPPNAEISDETKITMVQCATNFISLITSEAKRRCESEQRSSVTEEDLLWAMRRLGLHNYAAFCTLYSAYRGGPVPAAQPAVIANDSVPPPLSTASDAPTEKDESGAGTSSSGAKVYRLP